MNTPVQIHRAMINDLDSLFKLNLDTMREAYPDHNMDVDRSKLEKDLTQENIYFYIAYIDEGPVAFAKLVLGSPNEFLSCNSPAYFEMNYVLKSAQGLGIGTRLFEVRKQTAIDHGSEGGWLTVWDQNNKAIAFHEKNGFKTVGKTEFVYTSAGVEKVDIDLVMVQSF